MRKCSPTKAMAVLMDGGEAVATIRHPRPEMAFPMFRYECKRCGDNLGSTTTLDAMKRRTRRHQREVHDE